MRTLRVLVCLAVLAPAVLLAEEPKPASDLRERRHALINLTAEYLDLDGELSRGPRLPDFSEKAEETMNARARDFLPRFEAIDTTSFPEQEVLNKSLMVWLLRQQIDGMRFRNGRMPVNQLEGIHLSVPPLLPRFQTPTTEDYENLGLLYAQLPKAFDQTISNMRKGMAEGVMPPRYVIEKVIDQVERTVASRAEDTAFAEPLASFPPEIREPQRRRIRKRLLAVIRKSVLPAYARFGRFLREEYAPLGRPEPGLWALPDGEARYAYWVRVHTTSDLTPEEIHQIGLREVARIEGEMTALAGRLGHADIRSLDTAIERNPELRVQSREQLPALYRRYLEAMNAKLPELFGEIPQAELLVESFEDKNFPLARYVDGTPYGRNASKVGVNLHDFQSRTILTAEAIAYHEGVPGHHLERWITSDLGNVAAFRQGLGLTVYVEGWALYAERLAKEAGFYTDPYSDYGRLQGEMMRAIRLVVDTGLHYKRWTREQAVQYFRDHSAIDEAEIQVEVDRYVVWPGQALAYKIGERKILELRERARTELGEAFDLRKFHDQLLGAGALPLDFLEERMERWIARSKALAISP
jgi:uncharacterized protein (DUF885 family)